MILCKHPKISNMTEFTSAVVGMVLGDAWICPITKRNPNARLFLGHSMKQESYLSYKLDILSFLTRTNKYYKNVLNRRIVEYYSSVSGQTMCHPFYSRIRKFMYRDDGTKIVNSKILNKLDPLGLALWYMDDGSVNKDKRHKKIRGKIDLSTCNFTYEEHILIGEYFMDRWSIKTSVHKKGKYFRTYINHKNSLKFMEIIRPYIHSSMSYKIIYSV